MYRRFENPNLLYPCVTPVLKRILLGTEQLFYNKTKNRLKKKNIYVTNLSERI